MEIKQNVQITGYQFYTSLNRLSEPKSWKINER